MRKKKIVFWVILTVFLMFVMYGVLIEPYQIDVHHLQVGDAGVSKVLKGKIAVHISDLHITRIGKREEKVLKIMEELNPDLIFLLRQIVEA